MRIAFSAPGADHGWLAAITDNAREAAEAHDDVEFIILEGTNDSATQVTQVEQLIADDPDALVILPHEGDALTPVALQAMEQGIPVVMSTASSPPPRPTAPGSAATITASVPPPPASSPRS